jgi:3-oxoacyl-[acyl-carrier protein] reductase
MLLKDKNAIIFGAAGAIGSEVARAFAREGANLYLAARDLKPVVALAKEISAAGTLAEPAQVDALDAKVVEKYTSAVAKKAGGIDISFNLISIPHVQGRALVDLSAEEFAQPIQAFALTHFLTATAAARHMIQSKSGVILTLTAPPGHVASTNSGAFGPTCALIESLSRSLAAELGPHGVRVVCLRSSGSPEAPGVRNATAAHAKAEGQTLKQFQANWAKSALLGRLTTLTEVANVAVFMASDRASAITGTAANISCGLSGD